MIVQFVQGRGYTLLEWSGKEAYVLPPLDTPNGDYEVTAMPGSKYQLSLNSITGNLCCLTDGDYHVCLCKDVALELFGCLEGSFDIKLEKL